MSPSFDRIQQYLERLVPDRPAELLEMEAFAREQDFPIIGPAAGQFCYTVARIAGARRVFELGSGFGYSTAWFARAVVENGGGEVHHAVWDEDLSRRARDWLDRLGYGDIIRYHVGEAVAALDATDGEFDLVFNDIDKEAYPDSLDVVEARLKSGGTLLVDNAIWHGRIFDPDDRSPATRGVRELTRRLSSDPGWSVSLVPIRDGVLLARRR